MDRCGIYSITNLINHKTYIGSSNNLNRRKRQHYWDLENKKHDNPYLQKAYDKYGKKNLRWEILEYIERIDNEEELKTLLLKSEQLYLDRFICKNKIDSKLCYNICKFAGSCLGKTLTEEHKKKIGDSNRGKIHPEEYKKRMSDIKKNMSEETKQKIREKRKLQIFSKESIEKRSRKTRKKVTNITTGEKFNSIIEASKYYDLDDGSISKCCRGKRKSCGGYEWCYE